MHDVYEPGHQGESERESAVVCVLTRSISGNESQQQFIKEQDGDLQVQQKYSFLSHRGIKAPV